MKTTQESGGSGKMRGRGEERKGGGGKSSKPPLTSAQPFIHKKE